MELKSTQWIKAPVDQNGAAYSFKKTFTVRSGLVSATLCATAIGLYEAMLDGQKVSVGVLNPGFTPSTIFKAT